MTIPTPEGSYRTFEERKAVFQDILSRIAAKSSAEFVALGDSGRPPLGGSNRPIEVFGEAPDSSRRAAIHAVSEVFSACSESRLKPDGSGRLTILCGPRPLP